MIPIVRDAATALLRSPTVNRAVRFLAQLRGHRLVLVYHRVGPSLPTGCEIVPSVPAKVFREHLRVLGEIVDLVSLDDVVARNSRRAGLSGAARPAVAVTFDDDLPSHIDETLPILLQQRVPAAFFLSGRALHGQGAYWFQHLEALLVEHGEPHVAAMLGAPGASATRLAHACERDAAMRERVSTLASALPTHCRILGADGIARIAGAGMTIGFHTVNHDHMPRLDDPALNNAVSHGVRELASTAGTSVRYFAYPYGKADTRSAAAVRGAGFKAAFTGRPEPLRPGDDCHQLGRWEPGPLAVDDLLVALAVRLHRAAPRSRQETP